MASISSNKAGNRTIQFIAGDGKRRTVRLGKVTMKLAGEIKLKIEALNAAKVSGLPIDTETARWVGSIGDDLARKLAKVGLTAARGSASLDQFLREYIDGRTDVKEWTRVILHQSRSRLVTFFGPDKGLREITKADADGYVVR